MVTVRIFYIVFALFNLTLMVNLFQPDSPLRVIALVAVLFLWCVNEELLHKFLNSFERNDDPRPAQE